jgi:UTP:GlnB (protein PII) uridylyltransferase
MGSEYGPYSARAWFGDDESDCGNCASKLYVETPDRLGNLFAVVTAIVGARLKILEAGATIADGFALDWFLVREADGRPMTAERRDEIRGDVLVAIHASWQRGAA